jgi:hypothetical protein
MKSQTWQRASRGANPRALSRFPQFAQGNMTGLASMAATGQTSGREWRQKNLPRVK